MRILSYFSFFLFFFMSATCAKEVEGVRIKDKIQLDEHVLYHYGSGVRSKFFFDLYVGSLYVEKENLSSGDILSSLYYAAVRVNIISKLITTEKLIKAINEGFLVVTNNNTEKLETRIDAFKVILQRSEIKKGDQYTFYMLPQKGLYIFKNGQYIDKIQGDDFSEKLFAIWISNLAVDSQLAKKMLGQ